MTMNSSGPISLAGTTAGQSIEIENGGNGTTMISLNDTAVRALAGVTTPNSTIIMPTNFYGKSNRVAISYTFTSNTANASLAMSSISGYSSGLSDITITNNAGIYLYATTNTSTYGLNLTGGATGDTVTLVNNGYIMGLGGNGGIATGAGPGFAGGPAINVGIGVNITINNTNASAYIGGGGGGGGAFSNGGGGGAGGGTGGTGNCTGAPGGTGGSIGAKGGNGGGTCCGGPGGGGGRIFPGCGGAPALSGHCDAGCGGGAGGGGGGAGGGGAGGAGSAVGGTASSHGGGGGGGWGASGGPSIAVDGNYAGGAGGKAVNLNGKTVTWTSGNTTRVWGVVS